MNIYQTRTILEVNKAASNKNYTTGRDVKQEASEFKEWRFFSVELAERLGGMDGIPGAILCYGVHCWLKASFHRIMNNQNLYYPTTADKQKLAYRSLRQLEGDYNGLWDHSSLEKIVNRTEKKDVGLTVIRDRGQLHFGLSEELKKLHGNRVSDFTNDGMLGFRLNDAVELGIIPACFLASLRWQLKKFPDPVTDETGNRYGELSAKKLTERLDANKKPSKTGKRIYPISVDAAESALKKLRDKGKLLQHPKRRSFYRLPVEGETLPISTDEQPKSQPAIVDTQPAIVDTHQAIVDTLDEKMEWNPMEVGNLHIFSNSLYSKLCSKLDGKCLLEEPAGLRPSVSSQSFNISEGGKILLEACNEGLAALRHKESLRQPFFNQSEKDISRQPFFDNAIYSVDDYDKVRFAGIETPYEFITVDPLTGNLYSRQIGLDYFTDESKQHLINAGLEVASEDVPRLRELFTTHPALTPEHIRELLFQGLDIFTPELPPAPTKGHDFAFWRRKIKSLKQFLRYLPQLVREWFANESGFEIIQDITTGKSSFDYTWMEEPFLDMAFADDKTPILQQKVFTAEEMPVPGYYLSGGIRWEVETGLTTTITNSRLKPLYYSEWLQKGPVEQFMTYWPNCDDYNEVLKLPLLEHPKPVEPVYLTAHRRNGETEFRLKGKALPGVKRLHRTLA